MVTQKQIDTRDAMISFLNEFIYFPDESTRAEKEFNNLTLAIADADKEAAGMEDEMLDALIDQYELLIYNPFCSNDAEDMRKEKMAELKAIIERATGVTIDEALKAWEVRQK